MAVAKITSKGQTTIPLVVRRSLRLHPGDQIEFIEQPGGPWTIRPLDLTVDDIAGIVTTNRKPAPIETEDEEMVAAVARNYR
jgi:AbrB family looped-hinge helix DNA binding protein